MPWPMMAGAERFALGFFGFFTLHPANDQPTADR
jgi:hypothetical protein